MAFQKITFQRNGLYSSFQESLNEEQCFIPYASFTARKTNSMDDISRFYRYFDLIESNSETLVTWNTYLNILQDQLRSYETLTIMSEMVTRKTKDSLQPRPKKSASCKLKNSSKLHVVSSKKKSVIFEDCAKVVGDTVVIESSVDDENLTDVSSQPNPKKMTSSKRKKTREIQDCSRKGLSSKKHQALIIEDSGKVAGDTFIVDSSVDENESEVSDDISDISIYTRARLLKSICTETKKLAEKICKTVDIISRIPKKCSTCGGNLRGSRHFKKCVLDSEIIGDSFVMESSDSKKLNKTKTQAGGSTSYFSKKPATPDGESSHRFRFKNLNPLKKSSVKRLTYLFVKH